MMYIQRLVELECNTWKLKVKSPNVFIFTNTTHRSTISNLSLKRSTTTSASLLLINILLFFFLFSVNQLLLSPRLICVKVILSKTSFVLMTYLILSVDDGVRVWKK